MQLVQWQQKYIKCTFGCEMRVLKQNWGGSAEY